MDRKSSGFAVRPLAMIVLVAATLAPTIRSEHATTATFPEQIIGDLTVSKPTIVAQGRCFNGHCY
jgi:hypothetical protein